MVTRPCPYCNRSGRRGFSNCVNCVGTGKIEVIEQKVQNPSAATPKKTIPWDKLVPLVIFVGLLIAGWRASAFSLFGFEIAPPTATVQSIQATQVPVPNNREYLIPSIGATLAYLTFESEYVRNGNTTKLSGTEFVQDQFSHINAYLHLFHKTQDQDIDFAIESIIRYANGKQIRQITRSKISSGTPTSNLKIFIPFDTKPVAGTNDRIAYWEPGSYSIEIYADNALVVSGAFSVRAP